MSCRVVVSAMAVQLLYRCARAKRDDPSIKRARPWVLLYRATCLFKPQRQAVCCVCRERAYIWVARVVDVAVYLVTDARMKGWCMDTKQRGNNTSPLSWSTGAGPEALFFIGTKAWIGVRLLFARHLFVGDMWTRVGVAHFSVFRTDLSYDCWRCLILSIQSLPTEKIPRSPDQR
jgi:hypothetical protein